MQANKDIILIHGLVNPSLLDMLKERGEANFYILEGRPNLAAANILSKELNKRQITPTLIADNMAGFLFKRNLLKEVWLACQTEEAEGSVCTIGSLILGVLGKRHGVPVYTYSSSVKSKMLGKQTDILSFNGVRTAPKGIKGYVPLAEWVPAQYISKGHGNG